MKWRRAWLQARATLARPRVLAAARRAPPGLFHVVVPPRVLDTYEETAQGIVDALRALGRQGVVQCVSALADVRPLRPGDRVLVYGAHRFLPWRPPAGVKLIGVNVEQYPEGWTPQGSAVELMQKTDRFLAGCDVIVECNECLLEESARLGRQAAGVLPFAYTARFDSGLSPLEQPPFDIAFLGRPGAGRRREALDRLAREFSLAPSTVAWGRSRGEFLRRARIQLNLHQGEKPVLESHRFALCLANGAFVLSEPLPSGAPFIAGIHYAQAPLADWPAAIRHWLTHPEARRRIADQGRQFLRTDYTFEHALTRLLPALE